MHIRAAHGAFRLRQIMLALAAIATLAAMPARAAELPADLAKAVNDHEQATIRSDVALLADLVSEDYVLVNSDSSLQNKQQYLSDFSVPGFRVETFAMTEPMHQVWSDSALTGGLLHLSWTQEGESHSRLLRIAHVWTKEDGRWRLVYTQLTRIPE